MPSKVAPVISTCPVIFAPRRITSLKPALFWPSEHMNTSPPACRKPASSLPSKVAPVMETCPVIFAPLRITSLKPALFWSSDCISKKSACRSPASSAPSKVAPVMSMRPSILALFRLAPLAKVTPPANKSLSECSPSASKPPLISEPSSRIKLSVRARRRLTAPSIRLPGISSGRMSFALSRSMSPAIRAPTIRTPANGVASRHGALVNRSCRKRAESLRQSSCHFASATFFGSSGGSVPQRWLKSAPSPCLI